MSSNLYRYTIIGTGFPGDDPRKTGFGMAHTHYEAFQATGKVELVAIADPDAEAGKTFLEKHQSTAKLYPDYPEMLVAEKPDIVSICTWPHLHADMAVAAAEAGVKIIHCEKPMATTWADCKRMKAAADANGAKLSFGHQRRHIKMFQQVRQEIRDGAVGDLVMIEAEVGDMFDWGTHWLDMMQLYNEETPVEWVIGQIESHTGRTAFGAYTDDQALVHYKWKNGVRGLLVVGNEAKIGCTHRIIGTKGTIEVLNERKYRLLGNGNADWKVIEVPQGELGDHRLSALDIVRQLDEPGHKSLLSVDNVIQHTEVIFATYYSSKLRGRVDLPLTYEGNAMVDMAEQGEIGPNRR